MQTDNGHRAPEKRLHEHLTCRVPTGTLAKLNDAATRRDTERSHLVREIVLSALESAA